MLPDLQLRHLPGGPLSTFLSVDGGCPRFSSSGTSQGAYRRYFLALMVGALGSQALAPPGGPPLTLFMLMVGAPGSPALAPQRGPPSTFHSIDGGCSRISSSGTSRGGRCRHFLALMVGALGSPARVPPRGPTVDVF
jgi:hypothetical protein